MEIDDIVKLYNSGLSCAAIQSQCGIDRHKISNTLKSHGINVKSSCKTDINKINSISQLVVEKYITGSSACCLSKLFNVPISSIRGILKKNNIKIRRSKYSIDNNFFNNIDCEQKAYVLGILYADGYNYTKKGKILLELIDKDLIYEINEILKNEKPVMVRNKPRGKRKTSYRISIDNIEMSKKLVEKGCHQAKTFTIRWPTKDIVPENLLHHFLRGYFDGDGCFTFNFKTKAKQIQITTNINFLDGMINYLTNKIFLSKFHISQRHKKRNNNIRNIHITRWKDIFNFINLIYNNSNIQLYRKYSKCMKAISYLKSKQSFK